MKSTETEETTSFEKGIYGALLRNRRMELGYRKAEDFIEDLHLIGCDVSRAALYRIERGEQEPPINFFLASNLILCGQLNSLDLINPCIPSEWIDPIDSDIMMRLMKKNDLLKNLLNESDDSPSKAARYDDIMDGLNSYDFEIFPNGSCDENHLYITIATGYAHELEEYDDLESFEIQDPEDIERAVIGFLKRHNYSLEGSEIEKLVQYGERKILPILAEYAKGQNS